MIKWPPTREKEKGPTAWITWYSNYMRREINENRHDVSATGSHSKKRGFVHREIPIWPDYNSISPTFPISLFLRGIRFFSATEIEVSFLVWPVAIQFDQIPEIPHDRLKASWSLSKYSQICRCGIHVDTSPRPVRKRCNVKSRQFVDV